MKTHIDSFPPSVTKLVNASLADDCLLHRFKKAVDSHLIKKPPLPSETLKNYHPVSGLCYLCQGGITFMTVSLSVCLVVHLLAGLRKYYWLELHEKNQKMGPCPTRSH